MAIFTPLAPAPTPSPMLQRQLLELLHCGRAPSTIGQGIHSAAQSITQGLAIRHQRGEEAEAAARLAEGEAAANADLVDLLAGGGDSEAIAGMMEAGAIPAGAPAPGAGGGAPLLPGMEGMSRDQIAGLIEAGGREPFVELMLRQLAPAEAAGPQSSAGKIAADIGVDITTPEGQAAVAQVMQNASRPPAASQTTVNLPAPARENPWTQIGIGQVEAKVAELNQAQAVMPLIGDARGAIERGAETGFAGDLILPVRRLGVALGIGNADTLAETELLSSISSRLTPLMRPTGAGSSSDADMALFQDAVPNLSRSARGNLLVIEAFEQGQGRKRQEARILEGMIESGTYTPSGYAERVNRLGPVFDEATRVQLEDASGRGQSPAGGQVVTPEVASGLSFDQLLNQFAPDAR